MKGKKIPTLNGLMYTLFFSGHLLVVHDQRKPVYGGLQSEHYEAGVLQKPIPARQLDPTNLHLHRRPVLLAGTNRGRSTLRTLSQ